MSAKMRVRLGNNNGS
ncbi:hypothetical protein MTR67_039644 [Solanum verrucosum]|uniref:Uncharacterized protein n=1 Tax=Solanum verrucosum TaxID=315347 RepID=A0AAF0UJB8_SOLVR|nr:hypothetical protein MTR67_039644 [Solanum verrucosum]